MNNLTICNTEYFAIQIYALSAFRENANIRNLDSVSVFKGTDKYYRYIYGQYETIEKVLSNLLKIRSAGFKDAFITKWKNFKDQHLIFIEKSKK